MKKSIVAAAIVALSVSVVFGQASDAALRRVTSADVSSRDASGKLQTLSAAEHLTRAQTYADNRLFPQAREHWQKVFDQYPNDPGIPKALFGTARSYMWERDYARAVEWFEKLTKDHLDTKDGREGLAFKGASLVRLGKNLEAARVYEQYASTFPDGERVESSHLNIIDAYREAGKYDEANKWVDRTAAKFAGKPAEVNALHARLRMEIYRENWNGAIAAADRLNGKSFRGAMAGSDEVKYLKALALEKLNRKADANSLLDSIPDSHSSYYSGLAAQKRSGGSVRKIANVTPAFYSDFPVMYRTELLQHAKKNRIDPRFLLAIMKQESSFRANAKSPAGARGLLQLVYDTAIKYNKQAGLPNLRPDDLYKPAANIAIGSAYVGALKDEFGGLYEAIAASYNGGEDNAARWLSRSKPKEAGVFAAEVGFAETKNYVFKVMNNYRIYRELYDENLNKR